MLKRLLGVRFHSFLSQMSGAGRTGKNGKPVKAGAGKLILLGILFAYCFGMFGFMFYYLFSVLGTACEALGYRWLYFALAGLLAVLLSFIGSVFSTQSQMFDAKDNELLLSMPIPPRDILLSRLLFVVLLNLLFTLLVMIPCGIAALAQFTVTALETVFFVVAALLLPLLTTALSCLFGWLLSMITAKMRNKAVLNTVFTLVFLAVYFFAYSKFMGVAEADKADALAMITAKIDGFAQSVETYLPPFRWLGLWLAEGSWLNGLLTLASTVLPFVLACWLLSRSFIKITTTKTGIKKRRYEKKELKVSSVRWALIKKELKRFTSSAVYMTNCGLGLVFGLVIAVVLLVKGPALLEMLNALPELAGYASLGGTLLLCLMSFMNILTAPSVSLEGKSLWISQALPVPMSHVLLAKVDMQLLLCGPVLLLLSGVMLALLEVDMLGAILLVVLPQLMNLLNGLFGVTLNLAMPKFDWISETVPIKQGIPVGLTMLGSMGYVLAAALLYFCLLTPYLSPNLFLLLFTLLTLILCAVLWFYLRTKGARKFAYIGG